MTDTRAVLVRRTGGPEVLELESVNLPAPGPRDALVAHKAIGVNFIDTYHRSGLYPLPLPTGIGNESVGVVEAVGAEVMEVRAGDRVACCSGPRGAYSERRVVPAERLVRLPADIDDRTAAAAMLKGLTAEYLIRRCFRVERGHTVLLHAAAGGVGSIASQWLAHLGARVIGTVGNVAKVALARSQGCHEVIDLSREDFVARARELTGGRGVDVVFDSIGKTTFLGSLDCLRPRGMCVLFGNASGKPEPFDPMLLSSKHSLYLTRPSLHEYVAHRDDLLTAAEALFTALREGSVRIAEPTTFPLAQAAAAHRALESRATTGSILLLP